MGTAELIYQELRILPENLQAEVLDFIDFLKTRHAPEFENADNQNKLAELETVFAPYRKSLKAYSFDRDEANER